MIVSNSSVSHTREGVKGVVDAPLFFALTCLLLLPVFQPSLQTTLYLSLLPLRNAFDCYACAVQPLEKANGSRIKVITVNKALAEECSEGPVELFIVLS
ncbi:hypothetical protein [Ketobacter sp.]|uniref:hypothetical protein n=1 Tax=Ketobacter sp. TaxID=2083498 RepID=UPI0025B97F1D|nr:hypothetical protein [Ketobacter sp.]